MEVFLHLSATFLMQRDSNLSLGHHTASVGFDIQDLQKMNPNDFSDHLTIPHSP